MADWRREFDAPLTFLIVQLANYGPPATTAAESSWGELREAQRLAVAHDAAAGLAVAVDIGDRSDIHPANKQEVGRRLARAARHVVYGEPITPSGPLPLEARLEGSRVLVSFRDVDQGLVSYGAYRPIGFQLCGAAPSSCRFADATLAGDQVVLEVPPGLKPARVRYCWADSPVCTLYDGSGLPAGPFGLALP
jgi:sialate O-acetylesterase